MIIVSVFTTTKDYKTYNYIKNNNLQEVKIVTLDGKYYLDN